MCGRRVVQGNRGGVNIVLFLREVHVCCLSFTPSKSNLVRVRFRGLFCLLTEEL